MSWDFSTEPEFEERLGWARAFVREQVFPLEVLDLDHAGLRRVARPLQEEVKRQGLWAAHLSPELGGQGYGQLRLGLLHEVLGESDLAPFVFGCQAPDSGNAELIALAATPDQKERWLWPLLDGRLLSAYAMTELGTGSDPTQLRTRAELDGGEWVVNGHKWFVGNASRGDFHVVMVVTEPEAAARERMSMIVIPRTAAGVECRDLGMMSDPERRHPLWSHCEVRYTDVRVPADHLLGKRGQGFALAQQRLGPGRIHHCMRWLGVANRALRMLCERAVSTSVHGGPLAEKQTVQNWVADSRAAMAAARLLTLHAAWRIDRDGSRAARVDIAMIKYFGATVMHDVLDRAIQVHGSLGYSTDMPLEQMYRWSRAARLYDGPDEVHRVTVARATLREAQPVAVPTEHVPTRRAQARARHAGLLDTVSA